MHRILIAGGCGFVGSNLALFLKSTHPDCTVVAFDNMMRHGSDFNKKVLEAHDIQCVVGDTRDWKTIQTLSPAEVIIDAAAEPSVTAGLKDGPKELLDINLGGTIHCLELARKWNSKFVFLSTSRIFPYAEINAIPYQEQETRFEFEGPLLYKGFSETSIGEGSRSFYGASKLASELLVQEYHTHYGLPTIINRFGVIAGPGQMGKVDQGFVALWIACHLFDNSLNYIGFGGKGKQVRDVLHIDDVCRLLGLQLQQVDKMNGRSFNVGGGWKNSISLMELTDLVSAVMGKKIPIGKIERTNPVDVRIYYTDNGKISQYLPWIPQKTLEDIVIDTVNWMTKNQLKLAPIFNQ